MKTLSDYVKSIVDFPKKGVIFRDVTSVLETKDGLKMAVDSLTELCKKYDFDYVAGTEARGFIFGMPVAYNMNKGFIPVRKKGKLPRETVSAKYDLEYGTAELELHKDSLKKGDKVLIVDDLIATGGTVEAAISLIEGLGAEVAACVFLIELPDLKGREKLHKYRIESVLKYKGE